MGTDRSGLFIDLSVRRNAMLFYFFSGTLFGMFCVVGYGAARAMSSDGWDDSNVFNFLRLLLHVFMHPEDFGELFYLNDAARRRLKQDEFPTALLQRPFWYISQDEFEGVVRSRPE
jgi:hypothetical protein